MKTKLFVLAVSAVLLGGVLAGQAGQAQPAAPDSQQPAVTFREGIKHLAL